MSTRRQLGRMVDLKVGPMHVREEGPADAEPSLLVHGFSCSMYLYDEMVPQLVETYRVIRVDLRGHGCTGGPPWTPASRLN